MKPHVPVIAAASSLILSMVACSDTVKPTDDGTPSAPSVDDTSAPIIEAEDVSDQLEAIRSEYGLPALAGIRLEGDTVTHQGVTGVRKLGEDTLATVDDKWHIGSCTKAMTGTLVGLHVDDGLLDWTSTMAELFPDMDGMHDSFRDVTVEMLLSHSGGIDDAAANSAVVATQTSNDVQWRADLTRAILRNEPGTEIGSYQYSNYGYVMAGAALERLTDASWEELMRARLFEPLGMSGCGFGPADASGDGSQPWGHSGDEPSNRDNVPVLGPAGTVHCPLADWGRFISDQIRAYNGEESILSADQAEQMFTVKAGNYAMGWLVADYPSFGGTILAHTGSNTFSLADVLVSPDINQAYLAATNRADLSTDIGATQDTISLLFEQD